MQAPKAPDPTVTAEAQKKMNVATATNQQQLNMVSQNTPEGQLSYAEDGKWSDGTPKFSSTQTLSPENQKLYDNYMSTAGKLGDIAGTQASNVMGSMGQPFNFEASQGKKLADMQGAYLTPQWEHQEDALNTQLINQGIRPGTEQYTRAMADFSRNRQSAMDQNYLDSYQTAGQQALTERNQPLNEMNALMSGSQVQQPTFGNTPQAQVSGVDYAGLVNNNYNQKMASRNATMGGIAGLAGTALGGWARGGFAGV